MIRQFLGPKPSVLPITLHPDENVAGGGVEPPERSVEALR